VLIKKQIKAARIKGSDKEIPDRIELQGETRIKANGAGNEKITLYANSGKPMRLEGFFNPVIIDMEGARFDKNTTPIIADHRTHLRIGHSTSQVIAKAGQTRKFDGKTIEGPFIGATGVRSSNSRVANGYVRDAKAGYPFQVSVGADIIDAFYVEEDAKVRVNGKSYKGPLIVASKTRIRELSITVLGADSDTSAQLAARAQLRRLSKMTFAAYCKKLGKDPKTLSAKAKSRLMASWQRLKAKKDEGGTATRTSPKEKKVKANKAKTRIAASRNERTPAQQRLSGKNRIAAYRNKIANDQDRIDQINAVMGRFPDVKTVSIDGKDRPVAKVRAKAIKDGWTPEKFELLCHRADLPTAPNVPAIHKKDSKIDGLCLQASILRYAGIPNAEVNKVNGIKYGLESMFKPEVLERSHDKKYNTGGSIQAMLDMQIKAAGKYYAGSNRGDGDFIRCAHEAWSTVQASGFSTLNITNVLENVMHKSTLAAFNAVEALWPFLCGRKPLNDFKTHSLYRLDPEGSFRKVAQDGMLKHVGMTDTKKTISAETYGCMITIDRKTIKNDDLGVILERARSIGSLGGQRIEESVMVLLLSNPSSFFSSGNGNLQSSGGGSALSLTSLEIARQAFRNQVINGKPVGVSPRIMLVGTALETTAGKIWGEEKLSATGDTDALVFTNNPFKGLYRPYVSPYLNNTSITDQDGAAISGQSATQWYLFADPSAPQGSALVIGFVDGRETPFFDESETEFSVPGGIQFRAYLDWGVAMHIHQLAYKSPGA